MNAPRDRLEVVDGERPRIEEAVPAHHVERVVVEDVLLIAAAHPNLDQELTALPAGVEVGRRMDVTVVVRRALEDLPVLVAVAPRDLDQPGSLEDEVALLAFGHESVRRAARNDDVVAVLVGHISEDRLERAVPLVHEDHLVALAVPEEVVHGAGRATERDLDVLVPHQRPAAGDLVAFRLDLVRVLEAMRVRLGNPLLALDRREGPELFHTTR